MKGLRSPLLFFIPSVIVLAVSVMPRTVDAQEAVGSALAGSPRVFHPVDSPSAVLRPPYPLLFVHGLSGDDMAWEATLEHLRDSLRWGGWTVHDAVLNADLVSTRYLDDVKTTFTGYPGWRRRGEAEGEALHAVNFHNWWVPATGEILFYQYHEVPGQSESNQAAIYKHGYALQQIIGTILEASGADRVVLVGHSMGGLSIREYLQRLEGGRRTWWLDPSDEITGHHVARVVTYGTPHRGSNLDGGRFRLLDLFSLLDTDAEGVRDLRFPDPEFTGVYLEGGPETSVLPRFHNQDVNADGDEHDVVAGLNEGTTFNPAMPLPTPLDYTWITAQCRFLCGGGDGVVEWDRQWLFEESGVLARPAPRGDATLLVTNLHHILQAYDWYTLLHALDEPDREETAYELPLGLPPDHYTNGLTTFPFDTAEIGDEPAEDPDHYFFEAPAPGSTTVEFVGSGGRSWGLETGDPGAGGSLPVGSGSVVTISTPAAGRTSLRVIGTAEEGAIYSYGLRLTHQALARFVCAVPAGPSATIVLPSGTLPTVLDQPFQTGDELAVFSDAGTCVGAGVWREGSDRFVVTVAGDDPTTPGIEGLMPGEALRFRLWQRASGQVYEAEAAFTEGDDGFTPGRIYELTLLRGHTPVSVAPPEEVPADPFTAVSAYPNPFTTAATVAFTLHRPVPVTLTVYNALGQEVATLADGALAAGHHRFLWEGTGLPSGLYWYRLAGAGTSRSGTMVIVR